MYVTPRDSRLRYTKQCLFDAFLHGLETKPVSRITVSEICLEAAVSRKTFYTYYADQFDLLLAMQDDLFVGLKEKLDELSSDIFAIIPVVVRFAAEHKVLLRASLANSRDGSLVDKVTDYLYESYHEEWEKANPNMSTKDVVFLFHYVVSGLLGIVRYWLYDAPEISEKEVIKQADSLMRLSTPHA
ncbi:MAG: TetR/AcrR family transcriptional regulator [Actinomycetia bacterium]|nr:TetR/AcrR family transcriptional regulator [Actinomycetes bacterium]